MSRAFLRRKENFIDFLGGIEIWKIEGLNRLGLTFARSGATVDVKRPVAKRSRRLEGETLWTLFRHDGCEFGSRPHAVDVAAAVVGVGAHFSVHGRPLANLEREEEGWKNMGHGNIYRILSNSWQQFRRLKMLGQKKIEKEINIS